MKFLPSTSHYSKQIQLSVRLSPKLNLHPPSPIPHPMNTDRRDTAELHQMQRAIAGLLLYQDILDGEIGVALVSLLEAIASGDRSQRNGLICLTAYGSFFKALAAQNCSWEEYLIDRVLQAENPFSIQAQKTEFDKLSPALIAATRQDLQALHVLYTHGHYIPRWVEQIANPTDRSVIWTESSSLKDRSPDILTAFHKTNWGELVSSLAAYYHRSGVGIFIEHSDGKGNYLEFPIPIEFILKISSVMSNKKPP
jgi:uncharacterized protein